MKKVRIIDDNCIGCGQCTFLAPDVFEIDNDKEPVIAHVIVDFVEDSLLNDVQDAIENCPTAAIEWVAE